MKLSELYTEIRMQGFKEYIESVRAAQAANKTYETETVRGMARAGDAIRAHAEALRRVREGGMGRDITALEHPGAITSMAFGSRIQHNAEKLKQLRQQMTVEGIMGGAFPDVEMKKLGDATDSANVKLLRFNQTGRMVALLFGSQMPSEVTRTISSLGLLMTAIEGVTNRARIMALAMRGGMVVGAFAVGYGVGRMIGDPIGRAIYKPEGTEEEQRRGREADEANRKAIEATNRQNAIVRSAAETRSALMQIQLKGLDPLSKESEELQRQLLIRKFLLERGKAAAEAGEEGIKNAELIFIAESKSLHETMQRGRREREITEEMQKQLKLTAEKEAFEHKVTLAREKAADQARREADAAQRIREGILGGAIGAFPGTRGEIMAEQFAAMRMLRASGPEAEAMIDEFQMGRLQRQLGQERGILASIVAGRPQAIRGGTSGLEEFGRAIQSSAATLKPGEEEWQKLVANQLQRIADAEDRQAEFWKMIADRFKPGLEIVEGEF